jgi:hypothetical protein
VPALHDARVALHRLRPEISFSVGIVRQADFDHLLMTGTSTPTRPSSARSAESRRTPPPASSHFSTSSRASTSAGVSIHHLIRLDGDGDKPHDNDHGDYKDKDEDAPALDLILPPSTDALASLAPISPSSANFGTCAALRLLAACAHHSPGLATHSWARPLACGSYLQCAHTRSRPH